MVGQIIPWNFPILMAAWKLAPALAAGNCVVLKPAEQTPLSILVLMELIADILPPGVINIVNGFGVEAGKPLAQSKRIAKIAFTGETTTGRLIMQYASENIIPVTLELGGKSPNIFFEDVMDADDDFFDKALEGFAMFALNQGEVCTCPSRALVQESIYDRFMERAVARVKKIKQGHPLDATTMIGAQASNDQLEKILSYFDIGKQEGAKVLTGGKRAQARAAISPAATTSSRRSSRATTRCACSRRKSSARWSRSPRSRTKTKRSRSPTTRFTGLAPACGRATATAPTASAARIQAGRVWTNCYHAYPAHAAFGGYKAVRHRPRDPQDDARPLSADQEPAGKLQHQGARLLLSISRQAQARVHAAPASLFSLTLRRGVAVMINRVRVTDKAAASSRGLRISTAP